MDKLSGKVLLITECDSIIGTTTAKLAAKENAIVICTGKHLNKVKSVLKEVKKIGGSGSAFQHTISSPDSWREVVAKTIKEYGKIDVLINNAGIFAPKMMSKISDKDWQNIQRIDLNSMKYALEEVTPCMKIRDGGSIIQVSSLGGLADTYYDTPYAGAKKAILSLSRDAAKVFMNDNIRVNTICPGTIETPMLEMTFPNPKLQYRPSVQFPYLGISEDLATGIIYLASDESSFVTGAELVINGDRSVI